MARRRHRWEARVRRPDGRPKGYRTCSACGLGLLEMVRPGPRYMVLGRKVRNVERVPPCPGKPSGSHAVPASAIRPLSRTVSPGPGRGPFRGSQRLRAGHRVCRGGTCCGWAHWRYGRLYSRNDGGATRRVLPAPCDCPPEKRKPCPALRRSA